MLDKTPHRPDPDKMTRLRMQIRPALDGERTASDSVPDTLKKLAAGAGGRAGIPISSRRG